MRFDALALCALLTGCMPVDIGMGGDPLPDLPTDPCSGALPCPDGDPAERFARCNAWVCTSVEPCPDGRVCRRCWDAPAYRSRVQNGAMWSDGVRWRVCDEAGTVRASGLTDGAGMPECADVCEPGFCPAPDGAPLGACG